MCLWFSLRQEHRIMQESYKNQIMELGVDGAQKVRNESKIFLIHLTNGKKLPQYTEKGTKIVYDWLQNN